MSDEVIPSTVLDWGSIPHISTLGGVLVSTGLYGMAVDADTSQMQTTLYPSTAVSLLPDMVDQVK